MSDKVMGFFRYPGGKSKLRDQIAECLVKQANHLDLEYREPFFGGGSIGLKYIQDNSDVSKIWINDFDIGIACLWTSVIRYIDDFKAKVSDFKPSVNAFHQFKNELPSLTAMPKQRSKIVEIGFKKLAIHQISYSGLGTKSGGPLGGENQKSKYKINCRWSPEYICEKADKLHNKFAGLSIHDECCTNLDFSELITANHQDALIYLDPPYFDKGNDLYQHGFAEADHRRLADALKISNHRWILSYDDCPQIRKMYEWADFHSINVKYSITATKDDDTGERLSRTKPELLIYPNKKELKDVEIRSIQTVSS
jgi:DNA adenine methylase